MCRLLVGLQLAFFRRFLARFPAGLSTALVAAFFLPGLRFLFYWAIHELFLARLETVLF